MNEVANFCNGECFERERTKTKRANGFDPVNPPYKINNRLEREDLNFKTTDMDVSHYNGVLEYDAHNLYGIYEAKVTKEALESLKNKRAFVLSRSTFVGSGNFLFNFFFFFVRVMIFPIFRSTWRSLDW